MLNHTRSQTPALLHSTHTFQHTMFASRQTLGYSGRASGLRCLLRCIRSLCRRGSFSSATTYRSRLSLWGLFLQLWTWSGMCLHISYCCSLSQVVLQTLDGSTSSIRWFQGVSVNEFTMFRRTLIIHVAFDVVLLPRTMKATAADKAAHVSKMKTLAMSSTRKARASRHISIVVWSCFIDIMLFGG